LYENIDVKLMVSIALKKLVGRYCGDIQ